MWGAAVWTNTRAAENLIWTPVPRTSRQTRSVEAKRKSTMRPPITVTAGPLSGATVRTRKLGAPSREFLRTDTGTAAILFVATIAALAWVNTDAASYRQLWGTVFSIRVGQTGVSQDLHQWVNDGLMTFFLLVVGLDARMAFDLGELRHRRRLAAPVAAALGGMLVAVAVTHKVKIVALLVGLGVLAVVALARARRVRNGIVYAVLGITAWVAMLKSGVDPIVVGAAIGVLAIGYPAGRADLERATDVFRVFREQPTPELAHTANESVRTALSPNERLQQLYHPLSSYAVVPLFALANAGIVVNSHFLTQAYASPITLGILVGYVLGKPVGVASFIWLATRLSPGRVRPPVGWDSVIGAGGLAGPGFTVSLLIATLAFTGVQLQQAKLGVLTTAVFATALTWITSRIASRLPRQAKLRALVGTGKTIVDLAVPVNAERDHIRGPADALVTLVEYGDFECPHCGQTESVIRELLAGFGELRYVWRHLPLGDVHPHAQLAAEAAEAAGAQGKFWEMYDLLFAHQSELELPDLLRYGEELALDSDGFRRDLRKQKFAARVAEDVESADLSRVSGTPTFFINGRRHYGAYDIATLTTAVQAARASTAVAPGTTRTARLATAG
jgi:Na+/H+ antiporter NhaA